MLKSQTDKKKIALIGTGISGLSCLYFYLKKNAQSIQQVDVFEQHSVLGGVLTNTQKNGFVFEHGAQGVLSSRTNFTNLIKELKLNHKISAIQSSKAQRHFFFKRKIIRISPKNIVLMLRTNLISIPAILRILCELFVRKSKNNNETIEKFFTRRFGKILTTHFLKPVTKGIWGGGASQILMRFGFPKLQQIEQEHGSILRYFMCHLPFKHSPKKEMLSFEQGMEAFPHALFNAIQKICSEHHIHFNVYFNSSEQVLKQRNYNSIIYSGQPWKEKDYSCINGLQNALIVKRHGTANFQKIHKLWDIIRKIPTHSLCVVGIGSDDQDVLNKLDGFGALAVEANDEGVLGVICVHSLNPAHVPENSFLYRVILGGENLPQDINIETCTDMDLIIHAKQYLKKYQLLECDKTYLFEHVVRHIHCLPLATVYQDKIIHAVEDLERIIPGLYFVGNYLFGPAIDNCIECAQSVADRM